LAEVKTDEPSQEALGERIFAAAAGAGLRVSDEQARALAHYLLLLNRWNRVHSLTAIEDLEQQILKHLLDSLVVAEVLLKRPDLPLSGTVADVGSGMGAPGIVWAVVMPQSRFDLIERQQKKSAFLRHVVGQLGLAGRVAVLAQDVRELSGKKAYDLITSRAFAAFEDFLSLTLGVSRPGTCWAAMIGRQKNFVGEQTLLKMNRDQAEIILEPPIYLAIPGLVGERHLLIARRRA